MKKKNKEYLREIQYAIAQEFCDIDDEINDGKEFTNGDVAKRILALLKQEGWKSPEEVIDLLINQSNERIELQRWNGESDRDPAPWGIKREVDK